MVDVYLEVASKRVFAVAVDWPGWTRAGRTEEDALAALVASAARYGAVAAAAGLTLPRGTVRDLQVVYRIQGDAATDFGAPGAIPDADAAALTEREADRNANLLAASWQIFDDAARRARGVELRKGPRGGGRDLDRIIAHVSEAEQGYLG